MKRGWRSQLNDIEGVRIDPGRWVALYSKDGMITIHPEFPHEEGPKLFSIIVLVCEMIPEKRSNIIRIEKPFLFDSPVRKQILEQIS